MGPARWKYALGLELEHAGFNYSVCLGQNGTPRGLPAFRSFAAVC